jgi:hypothetical protein
MSNQTTDPSKVRLKNVRLSFPQLFIAKSVNGSEPKFSCSFLLDKSADKAQIQTLANAIEECKKAKWGATLPKGIKVCLHEGSSKEFDGYDETNMFVSTSSSRRPVVVDRDLQPLTAADNKPYAGSFCNATIRLWAQDNQFGKRVNAEVLAVQFSKDGEAFGGSTPVVAENEFTTLDDDDEDLT